MGNIRDCISIETIEDVATHMRILASEIGGCHHSSEEAECLINELANKLSDLNMHLNINVNRSLDICGISDSYRRRYLRQQNIKENSQ